MTQKPIIISIDRGNTDDFVKTTDENGQEIEQRGICKQVPNNYLSETFAQVIEYLCHPEADELNESYTQDEIKVAKKVEAASAAQGSYLLHRKSGEIQDTQRMYLSETIDKYFSQIVEPKDINIQGETQSYKSIDLVIKVDNGGGCDITDKCYT